MKTNVRETSLQAYRLDALPKKAVKQRAVLAIFEQAEIFKGVMFPNYTNTEIAQRLEWPINTVTPRVFELRKLGLLIEDVRRKCTITGRMAIAWKLAGQQQNFNI
jgi:hypothetical protein